MLTADLIVARSRRGRLEPRWIDPEDDGLLARAELILSLFRTGVGQTRAELREQFEHYGECHTHAYSSKCSLLTPLRPISTRRSHVCLMNTPSILATLSTVQPLTYVPFILSSLIVRSRASVAGFSKSLMFSL